MNISRKLFIFCSKKFLIDIHFFLHVHTINPETPCICIMRLGVVLQKISSFANYFDIKIYSIHWCHFVISILCICERYIWKPLRDFTFLLNPFLYFWYFFWTKHNVFFKVIHFLLYQHEPKVNNFEKPLFIFILFRHLSDRNTAHLNCPWLFQQQICETLRTIFKISKMGTHCLIRGIRKIQM